MMKPRLLVNLALVVVLAGLGLYAYLRPGENAATEPKITTLQHNEVTRIKVEHRGRPSIELEKNAGGWRLTAPLTARADAYQIDRITDIVNATSKLQLPVGDISGFDLTPPLIRVTLNDQTFSFGRINDVTNEQYVAIGESVHLIAPLYGYGIPSDPVQLASRRILGEDETPVAFEFSRHRILRENGQWRAEGAFNAEKEPPLSQDDFNRWADEWRLTSALAIQAHEGTRGGERLEVGFSNGKKATMQILRREPEFVLLRTDENMQYRFGVEVGKRLLDPRVVAAK